MHDRGRFWTPAPAPGREQFTARGVTIERVSALSQFLLSGPQRFATGCLAAIPSPVGFSGVASGATYAVAVARDRALIVSAKPLSLREGWDAGASTAVTVMDDAFLVLDLHGPGLVDVLSKATTLVGSDASPSASVTFAGFPTVAYRYQRADVLRVHVERPLAAGLREWLRTA